MYSLPDLQKVIGWGGVVAHKILVTAQVLGFGIWIGLWPWACQFVLYTIYRLLETLMMGNMNLLDSLLDFLVAS